MTYLAHRGLCRFVLGSSNPSDDITFVSETYFGKGGGFLITVLYYVFVIPVERELNLKQAAKAAAVKSISMIPMGDLLKVTGYIRGGCSPIGMKKTYPTFFDESAKTLSHIIVSAGKIGQQIDLKPDDLLKMTGGRYAAVTGV